MDDNDGCDVWLVRKVDVSAALAWMTLMALAVVDSVLARRELGPWCTAMSCLAALLTAISYLARRFDQLRAQTRAGFAALEHDAFERGLRAGMAGSGVTLLDEHQRI